MKRLITIALLCLCMTGYGQNKKYSDNSTNDYGLIMMSGGIVLSVIAVAVPDGGNWTYSNGFNSKVINKPFFQQPTRVVMLGIGVTLTIGGIVSHARK